LWLGGRLHHKIAREFLPLMGYLPP